MIDWLDLLGRDDDVKASAGQLDRKKIGREAIAVKQNKKTSEHTQKNRNNSRESESERER